MSKRLNIKQRSKEGKTEVLDNRQGTTYKQRLFTESQALKKQGREFTNYLKLAPVHARLDLMRKAEDEWLFVGAIEVKEFYNIAGIYYLFRESKCVYIGESECIYTRISQHIQEGVKNFTHFKILPCSDNEEGRKKLEKSVIKKYSPLYNLAHNKSQKLFTVKNVYKRSDIK